MRRDLVLPVSMVAVAAVMVLPGTAMAAPGPDPLPWTVRDLSGDPHTSALNTTAAPKQPAAETTPAPRQVPARVERPRRPVEHTGGGWTPARGCAPVRDRVWTVRPGDTLTGIARCTGVSVTDLAHLSGITRRDIDTIRIGQQVTVTPAPAAPAAPVAPDKPTAPTAPPAISEAPSSTDAPVVTPSGTSTAPTSTAPTSTAPVVTAPVTSSDTAAPSSIATPVADASSSSSTDAPMVTAPPALSSTRPTTGSSEPAPAAVTVTVTATAPVAAPAPVWPVVGSGTP